MRLCVCVCGVCVCMFMCVHKYMKYIYCGPDSSVGITTDYGLDGPGSNLGGDEILRQSIPALGPIQPLVKWVPFLSRG